MTRTAVCIVVENLPVPVDRRVWREACALHEAGYRVSVICPKGKGSCAAGYEVLDGIEIYRHRAWEASNIPGYLLEYGLALSAEFLLTLKVFARTRFRVLQACNPPDTIFLIALVLKLFGVRFIFDQHDLGPELFEAKFGKRAGLLYGLVRLMELCTYRAADVCIATNESFKEIAVTRGGKHPKDVFVVRNCPSLAFSRPQLRRGDKFGKEFLVAYVGFMGTQDGLNLLVESIEQIVNQQKRHDTHFVLIGGGSIVPELRDMIAARSLDGYVTLTGQVSHEEVAAILSNADVGVAPDPKNPMNDNSTMIKIFEYMAFGLPVVLFDLKEGRRVADAAALYATPNDPVDFANQIIRLLDSRELRRRLGDCGRKRIEEQLNWETEKTSLIRAYEATLQCDDALVRRAKAVS
jgi:glycosyltransferase involved in cell wall biosynthesis